MAISCLKGCSGNDVGDGPVADDAYKMETLPPNEWTFNNVAHELLNVSYGSDNFIFGAMTPDQKDKTYLFRLMQMKHDRCRLTAGKRSRDAKRRRIQLKYSVLSIFLYVSLLWWMDMSIVS